MLSSAHSRAFYSLSTPTIAAAQAEAKAKAKESNGIITLARVTVNYAR